MVILAKLKGDKQPREIAFTGHGQTEEARVREVFERVHPDGEFVRIVSGGATEAEAAEAKVIPSDTAPNPQPHHKDERP